MDGGTVWNELGGVEDANGYCNGYTMVFHPTDSEMLYVGGSYYDYSAQTTYMAVGRTTNQGSSWSFWQLTQDYGEVYALAIDATDPQTMYAGGYSSAGVRLFKSTSGGSTWTNVTGSVTGTVSAIAVDPSSPTTVYCGDYYGPYRSTDGGASWTRTGAFDVNSIAVPPWRSTELYAAGDDGVYASTDDGLTWTEMTDGLGNLEVWSLAAHPTTDDVVFAGSGGGGVFEYVTEAYIAVTSPAPGSQWAIGQTEQIQWTSWGTSGTVSIEISRDGGSTWGAIVGTFPDIGTYAWNVTGPPSVNCRVRITDTDGSPVGESGTFSISEAPYVVVIAPPEGAQWEVGTSQIILWASTGTSGTVAIDISRDGGATWSAIDAGTPDDGDYLWTVIGPASENCVVRVCDTDGSPGGLSGTFTIFGTAAEDPLAPATLALDLLGPNPASGTVTLLCAIPERADAALGVYDTQGRLYKWLHRGWLSAGSHQFRWGAGVGGAIAAPGLYVCRLQACGGVASSRVVVVR